MTPTRLRECLEAIDWNQRQLARLVNLDGRQVRRWATGAAVIPDQVAAWLETLAAFHLKHPPPSGRRQ